jgi:hypothetical protein
MSALAFLVRGRSVDLVAMTALHALRDTLGLGDEVISLARDEMVVIEGVDLRSASEWTAGFTHQQHWFNPNKHRFAAFEVSEGALARARSEASAWPHPWVRALIETDRPDLVALQQAGRLADPLAAWLGAPAGPGHFAVPLAVWDRESAVDALPAGSWPDPACSRLRAVLWTLTLKADSATSAAARAEQLAVTRARRQGLLLNPHMEGFAAVGPARAAAAV